MHPPTQAQVRENYSVSAPSKWVQHHHNVSECTYCLQQGDRHNCPTTTLAESQEASALALQPHAAHGCADTCRMLLYGTAAALPLHHTAMPTITNNNQRQVQCATLRATPCAAGCKEVVCKQGWRCACFAARQQLLNISWLGSTTSTSRAKPARTHHTHCCAGYNIAQYRL